MASQLLSRLANFLDLLRGLDLDNHLTDLRHCWITGYIYFTATYGAGLRAIWMSLSPLSSSLGSIVVGSV